MKHLFVPYELAKLAKEKGFNEPCLASFHDASDDVVIGSLPNDLPDYGILEAPLYQQLVDWFRDIHKIHVAADWLPNVKKYTPTFVPLSLTPKDFKSLKEFHDARAKYSTNEKFDDYYEALTPALTNAFELIP